MIEWQIVDIACQTYQKVTVSLYDTLGKDSVGMFSDVVNIFSNLTQIYLEYM